MVAQKSGVLLMYPMGQLRWKPTRMSGLFGAGSMMKASLGTSSTQIREVGFAHENRSKTWVGIDNAVQQVQERVAELHGVGDHCFVEANVGVVIYGAVAPFFLWDAHCWRKPQVG